MAEAVPETIREGTRAAEMVARPSVFMAVVALIAIGGVGALVWRDEVRADAQIRVMERMADEIGQLRVDFRDAGIRVTQRRTPAAVQASQRGDVE